MKFWLAINVGLLSVAQASQGSTTNHQYCDRQTVLNYVHLVPQKNGILFVVKSLANYTKYKTIFMAFIHQNNQSLKFP